VKAAFGVSSFGKEPFTGLPFIGRGAVKGFLEDDGMNKSTE
jgi:presenilin-like A22 family membrane protease